MYRIGNTISLKGNGLFDLAKQAVHICPWKIVSQHNIASGQNIKKSKYYVWTKYFDWKQTLLGSSISSEHNLQIVP